MLISYTSPLLFNSLLQNLINRQISHPEPKSGQGDASQEDDDGKVPVFPRDGPDKGRSG